MVVGERIKSLRIERGMTQEELGNALGVTKVSVCGYENGTRTPSLDTFIELADVFETTTDYLLGKDIVTTAKVVDDINTNDMKIINELKTYPKLYDKMKKDTKRYIGLISKKMI